MGRTPLGDIKHFDGKTFVYRYGADTKGNLDRTLARIKQESQYRVVEEKRGHSTHYLVYTRQKDK